MADFTRRRRHLRDVQLLFSSLFRVHITMMFAANFHHPPM
jgi:hypothetical protein